MLRDRTAIVGIGQTSFGKGLPDSEDRARGSGRARGARRRRHRARRGRRARVVHDGDRPRGRRRRATSASATSRSSRRSATAAAPGAARSATRRWRWRPGSARSRSRGGPASARRRRAGRGRRSQRSGSADHAHSGAAPFGLLRPVDEIAMLTRRYMHEYGDDPRPPRQRRARVPQARQPQPDGDDGRQAADARAVHGRALDLRAALPVRQLPRDRRRARGRDHVGRAGAGPARTRRRTSTRSRRASRRSTRR